MPSKKKIKKKKIVRFGFNQTGKADKKQKIQYYIDHGVDFYEWEPKETKIKTPDPEPEPKEL